MKALRRLRLPAAFAMALTLMACASAPATDPSVFDTLARANNIQPVGCDERFEIKSCKSTTRTRIQQQSNSCTCIAREAVRDLASN
jgi:hypothetical protein